MLKITFHGCGYSRTKIEQILPVAYSLERNEEGYAIYPDGVRVQVGACETEGDSLTIKFYEDSWQGTDFVGAFALKHSNHNPRQVLFAIVYEGADGMFNLDKTPVVLRDQAMAEVKHYAKANNPHLISFMRGRWDSEHLAVLTMQKILSSGELAESTGEAVLQLGHIENEKTV